MGYIYPCAVHSVSDSFQDHVNRGSVNPGTDYKAAYGDDVVSVASGVVTDADGTTSGSGGRVIHIDHDDGTGADYLHLSAVLVSVGQHVSQGQLIARSGASGYDQNYYYGPHLHISFRRNHSHGYDNDGNIDFDAMMAGSGGGPDADVLEAQKLLVALGYDTGGIDGINGPMTKAALIDYQTKNGLTVDGLVGPQTLGSLRTASVADPEVLEAQKLLVALGYDTGGIDGIAGPMTRAAVTDYQSKHGLTVDGLIGPQTLDALRSGAPVSSTPTPPATPPTGVVSIADISKWQGNPDFEAYKAAGVQGVIHKAGGSNSGRYTDSQYLTNVPRIRAAGLPLGHYWFNGEGDPTADADYFVANLASWDRSDLLALDVEGESGTAGTPWTPDKAKAFCDRVLARTGVHPHVYMSASVTRQAGWDALAVAGYPLWVASYGSNSGKPESLPTIGGWSDWNGWQYTSLFPGVGDMSEFKQFAGAVPVAPGTTTPVPPASSDSGYNASNRSTSWIQTQLNAIGHYGLVVDGIYGPATTAAVADYQHVHGLEVDGIAGNQTVSSLAGVTSPGLAVDGLWGLLTTKALQRAVGADPDGIIGPDTITKLQQHLGITADGINGPQTHVALQVRVGAEQDGIWGPETARKLQIALNAGSF